MVKREKISYKILGIKNNRNTYGILYKILQTRRIRKCIKVKKFYIPIFTIRKKKKMLIVWKPLREIIFGEKLLYTAMQQTKQPIFIINRYFDDYFLEFNDIKIRKEVKSKKLIKKLTKN